MSNLTVNDRVRLPDGRIAKIITAPSGTRQFVTVLVENENDPGTGRAYQIDVSQLEKMS